MKVDIGFFDINGNYIEDIQDVDEMEMDKEIIIDGVNVAGCKHLKYDGIKKPICRSGGWVSVYQSCLCSGNTECDYKQLQRLRQENADLKKYIERMKEPELKVIDTDIALENADLKAENERLLHQKNTMTAKYAICYATLAEIKEIAGEILCTELCNNCDGCGLINGCADTNCAYYQMDKIFTKISEVSE